MVVFIFGSEKHSCEIQIETTTMEHLKETELILHDDDLIIHVRLNQNAPERDVVFFRLAKLKSWP